MNTKTSEYSKKVLNSSDKISREKTLFGVWKWEGSIDTSGRILHLNGYSSSKRCQVSWNKFPDVIHHIRTRWILYKDSIFEPFQSRFQRTLLGYWISTLSNFLLGNTWTLLGNSPSLFTATTLIPRLGEQEIAETSRIRRRRHRICIAARVRMSYRTFSSSPEKGRSEKDGENYHKTVDLHENFQKKLAFFWILWDFRGCWRHESSK